MTEPAYVGPRADPAAALGESVWATLARPFAPLLDGTPEDQGVFGRVDAVFQAIAQTIALPGAIADTSIAAVSSAILPPGNGMPAATIVTGLHFGLPHYHPTTVAFGIPLPGFGPAVLVGALDVAITGLPALRTGDVGFAFGCLGQPNFEVSTGSSSVFVGGKRAARMFDFTRHCNPIPLLGAANGVAGGGGIDLLSVALMTTSAAAHCHAAWTHAAAPPSEESELAAHGELHQAAVGVAQNLADAALGPLQNTIGLLPPVGLTGDGMVASGSPSVLVGGLPMPPVGDVLNTHWHERVRRWSRPHVDAVRRALGRARCATFGDPVDATDGSVFSDWVDVDRGDGLSFARHYDTRERSHIGDCGRGMRHTYERQLDVWLHAVEYVTPDGARIRFPAFRGRDRVACGGYVATRQDGGRFEIAHRGEVSTFQAVRGARAARLERISTAVRVCEIEHDARGRFSGVRLGPLRIRVASRDGRGRITRLEDERGLECAAYAYDADALVAWRDASGAEHRLDHDADGRLVGWRDARGHRFVWRYDDEGRCVHTSGQGGEWACDLAYGKNETRVTHASGLTETIRYDVYGTVLHVARSDGAYLIREQDETLRVVRERDAAGRVTELVYDADGGLAFRRDRFGSVLPSEPGPHDLSPRARVLPETYAARLGAPEEREARASTLPSTLEPLAAWALPTPRVPRAPALDRDALGRVVRGVDAEGRTTTFARDAAGNVVSIVDRDRRETRAEIDGWKLATSTTDAIGRRVDWAYTATEEVRSYRDPRGVVTEYGRDAADRMISVTRGGRLRASYAWDAGDRLVEKRDGQGALVLRVSPHANALPGRIAMTEGGTIELDYDARGRVARAKLGEHDARLERDDDGTILFDRIGARGVRRWRLGAREVTSLFERFEAEISREGERVIVRGPTGALSSFALGGGRFVRRLANGTEDVLAIDPEGRLEGRLAHRRDRDGALSSWAVRYERSGEGDVLSVWDTARGERRFEIDAAHRLEAEHDERGNRHLFTHDEADDLLAIGGRSLACHEGLLARAGHETLTHDARDRLSVREDERARRTRYAYDDLDQLVRVDLPDGRIWRGSYDGLGRLRRFGIEGAQTDLFWDGDRLAAEVGPEGALRVHLYSDARALIPFGFVDYESEHAVPESGKAYYVFHDASGMPTQIEDAQGRIVWWADRVDPYGALTLHEGAEIDYALRWPGHVFDRALGLHHNRFRAYDPALGRYLQPDPLGHAGSPHSLHAYAPNPLVDVDVLGLTCDPSPIHEGEEPHEGHPLHEHAPRRLRADELTPEQWVRRLTAHVAIRLRAGLVNGRWVALPTFDDRHWDPTTRRRTFDPDGNTAERAAYALAPDGIVYSDEGDPQLRAYAIHDGEGHTAAVTIDGFSTSRTRNMEAANARMRALDPNWVQPEGTTWHELPDRRTMVLVPTPLHQRCPHTGGIARQIALERDGSVSGAARASPPSILPRRAGTLLRALASLVESD